MLLLWNCCIVILLLNACCVVTSWSCSFVLRSSLPTGKRERVGSRDSGGHCPKAATPILSAPRWWVAPSCLRSPGVVPENSPGQEAQVWQASSAYSWHIHTHFLLRTWNQVPDGCRHKEEAEEGPDKGQRNQCDFGFTEILKTYSFLLLCRKIPWHSF